MRCSFYGEDFCVLNGAELKNVTLITIGVFCKDECEYSLQAELTEELFFQPGKSQKLYFNANQERIIRFAIPNDPNITTVEIQGINENKFDKFNMIMGIGNNLPRSDNALYLRPAWENGYVGKFTQDCFCFCRGCNYTILISSEKAGYITVGSKVSGQVVDITSSDGVVYDSVINWHTQCYSYNVFNELKDLRIKLESYAGDPDVYINPGPSFPPLQNFKFNSRDHFQNEELVLTPLMRKKHNATKGLYHICIYGQTAATYKLTVKNEDHDNYLTSGLSESGYVDPNDTSIYYFRDSILAEPNIDIEFGLHVMIGKARLRSKLCPIEHGQTFEDLKKTCTFTLQDLLADDPNEKIMQHMGSESEKTNTSVCKLPQKSRDEKVSCAYIIGILGMANIQTHFSVLVKANKQKEHTIMKEGKPVMDEMKETDPQYYKFKVDDPRTAKVTIQLTTIHGDPDMFLSRKSQFPSYQDFEARSIHCGIYPEIIQIAKNDKDPNYKTLVGDYYVTVFGYVQSTFSLVYFIEFDDGNITTIHLMSGQKQRGTMKAIDDQLVYEFKLSNLVKENVEIRLHAENGNFDFYLGREYIPNPKQNLKKGTDHEPIIFNQDLATVNQTYYVRVIPRQAAILNENQTRDSAGMAFVFNIAFYEQGSFIKLQEGVPLKGVISDKNFTYYQYDMIGLNSTYEIALTSVTGNADLVISLNFTNKFPNKETNDYISEDSFATDSVLITPDMIKEYQNSKGTFMGIIYVGVYTNFQNPATYTIVITEKEEFNPIMLTNGQGQAGKILAGEEKFYYFKTSSEAPVYATLSPKQGNPDLEVSIIKNLSESKYYWKKYSQTPFKTSELVFGSDQIYLSPNNTDFKKTCGYSCILLFRVVNKQQKGESNFLLTVTRDILELTENTQIQDQIRDFGQYRYYRFYKACEDCDLQVTVTPLQQSNNLLLVADFEVKQELPTHSNFPPWQMPVLKQTQLVINSDHEIFDSPKDSKGMYTIGVHSHQASSYLVSVATVSKDDEIKAMEKVFLGETEELEIKPHSERFFYLENWSNSSIQIKLIMNNNSSKVQLKVASFKDSKILPETEAQILKLEWTSSNQQNSMPVSLLKYGLTATLNGTNTNFCVQCYIIIQITNENNTPLEHARLLITQDFENGAMGFVTNLILGRPFMLALSTGHTSYLNFIIASGSQVAIDIQYFYGKATYKVLNVSQSSLPYTVVQDSPSKFKMQITALEAGKVYQLEVKADRDLQASLLLSQENDLTIISDGFAHSLFYEKKNQHSSRFFSYLPPSSKFQLAVESSIDAFDALYAISIKKISTSIKSRRNAQAQNMARVKPQNTNQSQSHPLEVNMEQQWWQKYQSFKDYDYTIRSINTVAGISTFDTIPMVLDNDEDMLLIKVDLYKAPSKNSTLKIALSGSQVQLLIPGTVVRGHVSNWNATFKIYELFVNQQMQLPNETTDLYIEVTPCNGRVDFYVSEEEGKLFNNQTQIKLEYNRAQEKFGKQFTRIRNVKEKQVVFIGVQSSNEMFHEFSNLSDSYYQIWTRFIKGSQKDMMETYTFIGNHKEIDVKVDDQDKFVINWNQIYRRSDAAGFLTPQFTEAKDAYYKLFGGANESNKYQMNSICAIEHAQNPHDIFGIMYQQDPEHPTYAVLHREDLEHVKVLGIIALIVDPETKEVINLAYEPFVFLQNGFGVRVEFSHLVIVIGICTLLVLGLGLLICLLRRSALRMKKRLDHEINYVQQNFSSVDITSTREVSMD